MEPTFRVLQMETDWLLRGYRNRKYAHVWQRSSTEDCQQMVPLRSSIMKSVTLTKGQLREDRVGQGGGRRAEQPALYASQTFLKTIPISFSSFKCYLSTKVKK